VEAIPVSLVGSGCMQYHLYVIMSPRKISVSFFIIAEEGEFKFDSADLIARILNPRYQIRAIKTAYKSKFSFQYL
jgi:hypothetical protein